MKNFINSICALAQDVLAFLASRSNDATDRYEELAQFGLLALVPVGPAYSVDFLGKGEDRRLM